MQRTFLATVVQTLVLLVFSALVVCNVVQVNDLQKLTIHQAQQLEALNQSVTRLEYQLSEGLVVAQGGAAPANASTGDPQIDRHARYYSTAEWEALMADGNYISPRTDQLRDATTSVGGTLRRSFITDIPGLNPISQNASDVTELYHYVSEALAERQRDEPDRWVPQLAHRIEVNDDHTAYHVYLREGILWHPPAVDLASAQFEWLRGEHELVADDFVFALEMIQNPQVEAGAKRNYYEQCDGIQVINDHEFVVHWSEPTYQSIAFTLGLEPLPRWLYGHDEDGQAFDPSDIGRHFNDHWYNQRAIGTGPYRFVSWEQGGAIVLDRWERYHSEHPPIDRLEFRIVGDATSRLNQLLVGDLDYITVEPAQYANEVQEGGTPGFSDGSLHHETYQGSGYRYLGWNADGRFFSDRRVRLAMTHAFNREATIEHNMHGLGRVVTGSFFIDGPDYDHDIAAWPFDLVRAAELLDEAGWQDNNGDGIRERLIDGELVNFEFGMLTYGYRPEFVAAMEAYRNDLRRVGVIMNIEPVEWSVMLERMQEKDFDAYTGGWVLGWEADPYQIWHSSQADIPRGSNRVGFRNAEADEIIETARRTFEPAERQALFRRFHQIVHEEQPYTFWFSGLEIGGWRDGLEDVTFAPIRPFDSSRSWSVAAP